MKKYRHIFFDLDHTLWDYDTNSRQAITELYERYDLRTLLSNTVEEFLEVYYRVNEEKWKMFHAGQLDRDTLRICRITETFGHFGCLDTNLCIKFDQEYRNLSPLKATLIPGAVETLKYLSSKYKLHIITNGFAEIQEYKIRQSGLSPFFLNIFSSEQLGASKPSMRIFRESVRIAKAKENTSLMVGDNLDADVLGARNCHIDQVYFNPKGLVHDEQVTYEIKSLRELRALL